jgi:KDO2-lipid IV(A) lauroyltransferase
MSLWSATFSKLAYGLLLMSGWKRKVVEANLKHAREWTVQDGYAPFLEIDESAFYRQVVNHLASHVSEILFHFDKFKKLPTTFAEYPHRSKGVSYEIAPGSEHTLEKMKRGGIFLTAHYGNYEAMGPWLCRLGIPLMASYIPLKPKWLNRIVEKRLRSVNGASYAVDARNPREFLRLLDERKLFCLLTDQDSRIQGALDDSLLGRHVHVNPLPGFLLKHRPGTPVFVCWIEEKKRRRILHAEEITAEPPQDAAHAIAGRFNRWLEERIEEDPTLWYSWTHRRFYSCDPGIY